MREYGLLIRPESKYGTEYIKVMAVAREAEKDYPLGCSSDGESEYDRNVPKHMHGLMVDGLGIYGFINVTGSNEVHYLGYDVEYQDVFAIHIPKAQRMIKTLKKVVARMRKDDAREPGDRFFSLAKALKLSFAVVDRGKDHPNRWGWMSVTEGREHYRNLITETIEKVKKQKGIAA